MAAPGTTAVAGASAAAGTLDVQRGQGVGREYVESGQGLLQMGVELKRSFLDNFA